MKICIECKHSGYGHPVHGLFFTASGCPCLRNPPIENINLIDGTKTFHYVYCWMERSPPGAVGAGAIETRCGEEGKYFEPKMVA